MGVGAGQSTDQTSGRKALRLLVPALLLVLIVLQLIRAFRGFDATSGGLLAPFELPGRLLGWGGVLLLLILLAWSLLGARLGGTANLALRLLGTVALALSVAGLVGLLRGEAGGGVIGGGLAGLLGGSLGTTVSALILGLMALPSAVLAVLPLVVAQRQRGSEDLFSGLRRIPPGGGRGATPYPERHYDDSGEEIPISFETTDVGPIRYVEEVEEEVDLAPHRPEPVPAPPPEVRLADGVRFADEPAPPEAPAAPPLEAHREGVPLPPGVRIQGGGEDEAPAPLVSEEMPPPLQPEAPPEMEPAPAPHPAPAAARVEPGASAASSPGSAPPPAGADVAPAPRAHAEEAPREMVQRPPPARDEPEPTGAEMKDSIQRAMGGLKDEDGSARYRAKLESLGMFGGPSEKGPARSKEGPKPKGTPTPPAAAAPAPPAPPKKPAATARRSSGGRTSRPRAAETPPVEEPAGRATRVPEPRARPATDSRRARKPATPRQAGEDAPPPPKPPAGRKSKPPKPAAPKSKAPPAARPEADAVPAQTPATEKTPPAQGHRSDDALFHQAVEAALERGAASSVLLSRRLEIGYSRARSLMDRLVREGILGEMTASGSRPVKITREEWEARRA